MQPQNFLVENILSIIFLTSLIFLGIVYVRRVLREKDPDTTEHQLQPGTSRLVYHGNKLNLPDEEIVHILSKYNPYYSNLMDELQSRFKMRLKKFMQQKTFIIYAKEGYKEMPVLTSAAAIQLSFGLDNFMLPWFNFIQIHMEEYFEGDTLKVVNGEVDGHAIILAWNQFIKGINDPGDGENVGVHEMAHALYYQNVVVEKKEELFKQHFNEVQEQGRKIFELRNKQPSVFNDYAYKNLQEFWAESVEMFFEKPEVMQIAYNELFVVLKQLLQQDTLNKSNPLLQITSPHERKLF